MRAARHKLPSCSEHAGQAPATDPSQRYCRPPLELLRRWPRCSRNNARSASASRMRGRVAEEARHNGCMQRLAAQAARTIQAVVPQQLGGGLADAQHHLQRYVLGQLWGRFTQISERAAGAANKSPKHSCQIPLHQRDCPRTGRAFPCVRHKHSTKLAELGRGWTDFVKFWPNFAGIIGPKLVQLGRSWPSASNGCVPGISPHPKYCGEQFPRQSGVTSKRLSRDLCGE